MPKKKLNAKVRKNIKENYRKLKKKDFSGEALVYLNRVRGAAKARAIKKKNAPVVLKIDGETVEPGSALYRLILEGAKQKGQTPAKFIKENKATLKKVFEKGKTTLKKEANYIARDIRKKGTKSVTVKGKKIGKVKAGFLLQEFRNTFVADGDIYPVVILEYEVDFKGNMFIDFPFPDEYQNLDESNWQYFIDKNYPKIDYIPHAK